MWIHKAVYEKLYLAFAQKYVDYVLLPEEGRGRKGNRYKLKSLNIWGQIRRVGNDKFYVITQVTKKIGNHWIYYRLLTNYDSEREYQKGTIVDEYQDIPPELITAALQLVNCKDSSAVKVFLEQNERSSSIEQANILLNSFIQVKEHSALLPKLSTEHIVKSVSKSVDLGLNTITRHNQSLELDILKHQYQNFISAYLDNISKQCFKAAFAHWDADSRSEIFRDDHTKLILAHPMQCRFEKLHLWDHEFDFDEDGNILLFSKCAFSELIFLPEEMTYTNLNLFSPWAMGYNDYFRKYMDHILNEIEADYSDSFKDSRFVKLPTSKITGANTGDIIAIPVNNLVEVKLSRLIGLIVTKSSSGFKISNMLPILTDGRRHYLFP